MIVPATAAIYVLVLFIVTMMFSDYVVYSGSVTWFTCVDVEGVCLLLF